MKRSHAELSDTEHAATAAAAAASPADKGKGISEYNEATPDAELFGPPAPNLPAPAEAPPKPENPAESNTLPDKAPALADTGGAEENMVFLRRPEDEIKYAVPCSLHGGSQMGPTIRVSEH